MLGHDSRALELPSQRGAKAAVHPRLPVHLRLLENLEAPIKRQLPQTMLPTAHTPSTSTRPAAVTRTSTMSREGSGY